MNKNVKKIISMVLTVSAFCAIAPVSNLNLMTTKAYASSSDAEKLKRLKLETSGGNSIKLYDDNDYDNDDRVKNDDVEPGGEYYAKSPSRSVKIDTDGVDEDNVRIFKGSSKKPYKVGEKISLSSGKTTLKVKVYAKRYKSYDNYSEAEDSSYNEYEIQIKCNSRYDDDDDDDDDDEQDNIYLDKLKITHDGDSVNGFNFDEDKTSYDITVPESCDDVRITAEPEDEDDRVLIDDYVVDDDDYRRTVDLTKGKKNVIEVEVKNDDDDERRVYKLNITRSASTTTQYNNSDKTNQWVLVNGKWTYNDTLGNQLRNSWFYDKNYGKTYYLQADGTMATGWLYNNGYWYYLNGNGQKQTGWVLASGTWYYLDSDGKMQTGWFRDWNGKWYYLQSSGAMARNTIINGYRLGQDGAWINW